MQQTPVWFFLVVIVHLELCLLRKKCPCGGTSLELEFGEAADSQCFGSKEEVAILPLGCERGSSSGKSKGEVERGRNSGLEAGAGRFPGLLVTHFPLPSTLWGSAGDSGKAIHIDDAQCFMDESFWQRRMDNINVLQASLMANHLVTNMQLFIATSPTILLKTRSPSMCGKSLLPDAFQHWASKCQEVAPKSRL